jgi:hypothetical protein
MDVTGVLYQVVDRIKLTQGSLHEIGLCEYGNKFGSIEKMS